MKSRIFLAFCVILGLMVVSGCEQMLLDQSATHGSVIKDGQAQPEQSQEQQAVQQEQEQQQTQQQTQDQEQEQQQVRILSKVSGDSNVLYDEEVVFATFPAEVIVPLQEQTEVSVQYEADGEIQFIVYDEFMYNKWKETGYHAIAKANTKQGDACCSKTGSFKFDVNNGEGGQYYIVFDDSKVEDKSGLPTKATIKVTQTG